MLIDINQLLIKSQTFKLFLLFNSIKKNKYHLNLDILFFKKKLN